MFFKKKYTDKYWFLDSGAALYFAGLLCCKGFNSIKVSKSSVYAKYARGSEYKENEIPAYMVEVKDVEPKMLRLRKYVHDGIRDSYAKLGITAFEQQIVK